jgi:hypothetical protein
MVEPYLIPSYYNDQQKMIFELDLMRRLAEKWKEEILGKN